MFNKVLVPLDGSTLAECALSPLRDMAKDGSIGEVILLKVAEMDIRYNQIGEGFIFQDFLHNKLDDSRNYLEDVQRRLKAEGIEAEIAVIGEGRPAEAIAEYASARAIDLIIIASHGYSGLKKVFLGSVAFELLQGSHVPVLLIRPESCPM